ncbi:MAG: hypothetical protein IPI46_06825 [Bacteroidetes bacterium]|nr:hypothetical protein [Bacteroidota bacterium]
MNPFPFALIIIFLVLVFYIFFIRRNKNFTYVSRKGYNYDRGAPWLGGFGGFGGGSGWGNSGGGSSGGGLVASEVEAVALMVAVQVVIGKWQLVVSGREQ